MPRPPLHCLMYTSRATGAFDETMLSPIIEHARRANAARGITGSLFYSHGNFFQIVEGEQRLLTKLLAKLRRDHRHSGLEILFDESIEKRSFPDWCMELVQIRDENSRSIQAGRQFAEEHGIDYPPVVDALADAWSMLSSCKPLKETARATG